jgi:hypothetical protein
MYFNTLTYHLQKEVKDIIHCIWRFFIIVTKFIWASRLVYYRHKGLLRGTVKVSISLPHNKQGILQVRGFAYDCPEITYDRKNLFAILLREEASIISDHIEAVLKEAGFQACIL